MGRVFGMYYSANPVGAMFGLLVAVGLAFIPASIAKRKGYSYGGFWVFGFFLFLIALIVVLCLRNRYESAYQQNYYPPPPGDNQQYQYPPPGTSQQYQYPPPGANQQNYYPPPPGSGSPPYGQSYGPPNDQSGEQQ